MKIKKKIFFFFWGGGGGQGGCDQRSEAFVNIQKNWGGGGVGLGQGGGGGGGVRVDDIEVKLFVKIQKNIYIFFFGGGSSQGSSWPRILGRSDFSLQKSREKFVYPREK